MQSPPPTAASFFIGTDGGLLGLSAPAGGSRAAIVLSRCPSCLTAPIGRNQSCPRCMVHHIEHCMFAVAGNGGGESCHGLAIMRERNSAVAVAVRQEKRRAAR